MVKPLAFRWRAWREVRQAECEMRAEDRAGRKATRQARPSGPAPAALRVPRALALAGISVLVGAASLTSFAESYRGLYDWSHEHGLTGLWSAVWPLQVDVFIAVGELALFVALADSWRMRSRAGAWLVTLGGLAVSVAGNVGHVHSPLLSDRATAAVPPLAAAAALAVGLGVLKRVVARPEAAHASNAGEVPSTLLAAAETSLRATVAAGNPWSVNQLQSQFSLTRAQATKLRSAVLAETNGNGAVHHPDTNPPDTLPPAT
jgi:Protein of unknown function (DUF2637)